MKLSHQNLAHPLGRSNFRMDTGSHVQRVCQAGFTMVEVAIALAVIGFALVAIIAVLPVGMNVQRENREETIINHDALVLIETIRTGARRFDDLANYIGAVWVSNVVTSVNAADGVQTVLGRTIAIVNINDARELIGLVSTPSRVVFNQSQPLLLIVTNTYVIVHMRALTGSAVEKQPQANPTILEGAFAYRLEAHVAPCFKPEVTAVPRFPIPNLHEVKLTFRWPLLPNGQTGGGKQTFRTRVSGVLSGPFYSDGVPLYFFEPGVYVNPFAT